MLIDNLNGLKSTISNVLLERQWKNNSERYNKFEADDMYSIL